VYSCGEEILILNKSAKWLKTDGASKAEEMINGLNISDSSKSKMIDIIRDFTGTDGSGASSVRPPVTGTPYEEGNL
jgi:hypothetical protein